MERLELGEDNDGSEDEAAEAEAEVETGGQAEEEAEFAELQAEAMLAVEAELKGIGILNYVLILETLGCCYEFGRLKLII